MPTIFFPSETTSATRQLFATLGEHLISLEVHASTKWLYAASADPIGIKPGLEADALITRIFEYLEGSIGALTRTANGATFEKQPVKSMTVWSSPSDHLTTKFSLVNWEGSLYAFVSGDSEGAGQDHELWLKALAHALSTVNANPSHSWQALIGMGRDMSGGGLGARLENFTSGAMSAFPLDFEFEEQVPVKASLNSYQIERWQPFLLTGSRVGHAWGAVEAQVREDLHLLCALLSVETNRLWKLRQQPQSMAWGELMVPEGSATLKRVPLTDLPSVSWIESASDLESQLRRLWQTCLEDQECADIARAYYEATQMSDHPSFSLIGFVGVIEAVGAKLFRSSTQENCAVCGKPKTNSSAKRFRDALSLVVPPDRVRAVSERLYKWRSGTAHAGRLHSTEASFGMPKISESMTAENLSMLFQVRGPLHAQEISRDLLIHLLERRPIKSQEAVTHTV